MNIPGPAVSTQAAAAALVLVAAAAVGGYAVLGSGGAAPTGEVVRALELSTNQDLEVLQVSDQGSLDRVTLSDGNNVIEAYVTDDRRYLVQATQGGQVVQGFTPLRNLTRTLEARNQFISCLSQQNATFYGIVSRNQSFTPYTRSVQLQTQALGGQEALQLFGGAGPQRVRQLVLNYNRTRGIVWNLGGELRAGVQTVSMLEQNTDCSLSADASGSPY